MLPLDNMAETQRRRSHRSAVSKQNSTNKRQYNEQIRKVFSGQLLYFWKKMSQGVSGEELHLEKKIMLTRQIWAVLAGKLLFAMLSLEHFAGIRRRPAFKKGNDANDKYHHVQIWEVFAGGSFSRCVVVHYAVFGHFAGTRRRCSVVPSHWPFRNVTDSGHDLTLRTWPEHSPWSASGKGLPVTT